MASDRSDLQGGHQPHDLPVRRLVGWGIIVWAVVTVGIRLHGPVLLSPDTPIVVLGFFASVVPLMAAVTYPVYRWLGVSHTARPAAASLMALPGMVLDVLVVAFAEVVLPALARREVVTFGAILLFGYAVVLLTGYVPARRRH